MKLIKLSEEHYIVVDDSEIKEGDWVVGCTRTVVQCMYPENVHHRDVKKITHSTNIDWNEVYYIPLSEVKELLGVVDVEKKAKYYYGLNRFTSEYEDGFMLGFKLAYNQALEDNKEKKWTDEDVIKIVEKSRQTGLTAEYIILSLQPQTEWEVEIVDGKLKLKK